MKPPKLNQPMMNVPVSHMGQEHTKQISLSSKPRCVKIIPKWAFVRTELNVSSLMAHMNLFDLPKTLKKAYRTRKCKSFWEEGTCRYGFRCQFLHNDTEVDKQKDFQQMAHNILCLTPSQGKSRLTSIF